MKKMNENTKITLTIGQLKQLVKESDDEHIRNRALALVEVIKETNPIECRKFKNSNSVTIAICYDLGKSVEDRISDLKRKFDEKHWGVGPEYLIEKIRPSRTGFGSHHSGQDSVVINLIVDWQFHSFITDGLLNSASGAVKRLGKEDLARDLRKKIAMDLGIDEDAMSINGKGQVTFTYEISWRYMNRWEGTKENDRPKAREILYSLKEYCREHGLDYEMDNGGSEAREWGNSWTKIMITPPNE